MSKFPDTITDLYATREMIIRAAEYGYEYIPVKDESGNILHYKRVRDYPEKKRCCR